MYSEEFLEPPTVVCPPHPNTLLQVKNMSSTQEQSPPPVWLSTCARARRRKTKRCGQSNRSSRPDAQTAPPKSSTRGACPPSLQWCGPLDRPLKPATHPPSLSLSLSRLCTHGERRRPSFQFNYSKNKPTSIAQSRCLWGAWRWNEEAWRGWMRLTCTLITFCRQRGERWVCSTVTPPPYL